MRTSSTATVGSTHQKLLKLAAARIRASLRTTTTTAMT